MRYKIRLAAFLALAMGGSARMLNSKRVVAAKQAELQHQIEEFRDDTEICNDLERQALCVGAVKKAMSKLRASTTAGGGACLFHAAMDSDFPTRGISMMVRSFLATQASSSKLMIYSDTPDDIVKKVNSSLLSCHSDTAKNWRSRIEIKALGSDFMDIILLSKAPVVVGKTDLLRFEFLKKYGGIYVDADVLFLADLSPFCGSSFAYRWSFLNNFNTAVMGLPKESPYANALLAEHGKDFAAYHPQRLPEELAGVTLLRLPSLLFDPSWLYGDGYDRVEPASMFNLSIQDFDTKPLPPLSFSADSGSDTFEHAFPGSLAYHWHGSQLPARSTYENHTPQEGVPMAVQIEWALSEKLKCDAITEGLE